MMTAPEPDSIVWRTSSYSGSGEACVEIGWRTSSYSGSGSACVEVAPGPDVVLVRDSKDREGPALAVPTTAWRTFLRTITRGPGTAAGASAESDLAAAQTVAGAALLGGEGLGVE